MPKSLLLFLVCVAAGLYQNWGLIERWRHPPPRPAAEHVVLYATSWCGYCAKTRKFFADNAIVYQELNVEDGAEGARRYQALGGGGVPIVVVDGDQVIHGYNPQAIRQALEEGL